MAADVEVVPFHPRHLEVMKMREHEKAVLLGLGDSYDRIEKLTSASKEAGTILYDGRIITCVGFVELWPGVCDIWQVPSIYVGEKPILFARTIRRFVETLAETFKYHRMQTVCLDDRLHNRWMHWLKFEREGSLKAYTFNKLDYVMYARIF